MIKVIRGAYPLLHWTRSKRRQRRVASGKVRGGEDGDSSSSGGECEETEKPEMNRVQKCSVQITAKDFRVASDFAAKELDKDKGKNRSEKPVLRTNL